jgi:hypothetical protein
MVIGVFSWSEMKMTMNMLEAGLQFKHSVRPKLLLL